MTKQKTHQMTHDIPARTTDHGPDHRPGKPFPRTDDGAGRPQERAEDLAVAGRHKNTGQKDHKGAR